MGKWRNHNLEELAEIHNQKRIPLSKMERDRKGGVYPYYGASGIIDYIDDYLFDGEYVLLSEDGENLRSRKTPIAFKASGKFWVNNHAHILKGKKNFHNYLLIKYFANLDLKPFITGAVQPKLNKENLLRVPFFLPEDEGEQKAIAEVLSSLDDKIDLLHRQNKTLESLAETLFRQWFIEEAKDEWVETKLGFYLIPKKGENLTKSQAMGGDIPVVAGGLKPSCFHNRANTDKPVITISASGANAGFIKLYYESVWSSDSSYIDSSVTKNIYFIYNFLKVNQIALFKKQTGSAQPHIYPQQIMDLDIRKYPQTLIDSFEHKVIGFFAKISNNNLKLNKLTHLRDILLPNLMSGKVRISI